MRTLYLHEIGYLELQMGKGWLKVYLHQHDMADKEAQSSSMHCWKWKEVRQKEMGYLQLSLKLPYLSLHQLARVPKHGQLSVHIIDN